MKTVQLSLAAAALFAAFFGFGGATTFGQSFACGKRLPVVERTRNGALQENGRLLHQQAQRPEMHAL